MFGESFQVFGQRVFSGASSSCPGSLHGRIVQIRSSDAESSDVFELEAEAACLSGRLRKIIATQGLDSGEVIELPLRKAVLKKVFEYCKHYRTRPASDLPTPFLGATLEECGASKWDASFVSTLEQSLLFEVMIVAGFLEIPGLTHLLSAHTCLMVRGKSTDRVRKELGLLSDLSAEEEAHLISNWRPSTRQTDANEDASADDGRGFGGIAAVMQQLLAAADRTGIVWEDVNGAAAIDGGKGESDRLTSKPKSFRQAGWRTAVLDDWRQLGQAPDDIRCDRAIVSAALESSAGAALPLAADSLRADRHLVLRAVSYDGARLGDASLALRSDEDFVLEACSLSGDALAGASAPLRNDAAFVKRAVAAAANGNRKAKKGGMSVSGNSSGSSGIGGGGSAVLAAATSNLRGSADFVLECVATSPESLRGASKELREDRAFMLRIARECGAALRYMEPTFRADAEVVKLAVAQEPHASAYAHVARRGELGVALPWDTPAKARVQVMKQVVQTGSPGFKEPLSVVGPNRAEVKDEWARIQGEAAAVAAASGEGGTGTSMRKLRKSVQFSALISLLSNPGQGNYCASNCYLDKLPAYQRPAQIEAVTLMWGPVGSIGMRWKAFGEADVLLAQPDLLLTVNEAAAILRMTVARADPPEWYGVSLFDEGTRSAVLQLRAGDGSGGGWKPSGGRAGGGREEVALAPRSQRRQDSTASGIAAARARASGHPSTAASARGGGVQEKAATSAVASKTTTRRTGKDQLEEREDEEEVLEAAPKLDAATQAAQQTNPTATAGTSSSSSSSASSPSPASGPSSSSSSKPLSGWPGLAQAGSSIPAAIREGSRVQLHGVGSKSGLMGTAIKQTVDGRWKVRLDGERAGNALLRESLLLPLPDSAAPMPTPVQRAKPAVRK
mmetsp:Transcript_83173/g.174108  ORF Transcript_83173/g.174108 Transcript_83173/m.174108 type:complete len:904 (+) Transcript_83173:448-3159(+)